MSSEEDSQKINTSSIVVNGVALTVEYKDIKHIHLSVYPPDGHAHISAPLKTSDTKLKLFILKKWIWLSDKIRKATEHSIIPTRRYVSGEEHLWRGQSYRLKVIEDATVVPKVLLNGDYLNLYVPLHSTCNKRMKILEGWYRNQLNATLDVIVPKWEERLGVKSEMWDILKMRARWGSCNSKAKVIYFNLELAKKPISCVEYIVVHELAHLLEKSHNDRFQQILQTYLPTWQEIRRQLNELPISEEIFQEEEK
ncbi:MAG: M48 family metallopeptidase [Victivallales bacterium]|nr:M48 family metallopeptidase [Victivallales bacterium]